MWYNKQRQLGSASSNDYEAVKRDAQAANPEFAIEEEGKKGGTNPFESNLEEVKI